MLQSGMEAAPLKREIAIVTGGGRGVGRALAEGLAAAGAAVAVAARSRDQIDVVVAAISAAGGRAIAVQTDVTEEVSVHALVKEVQRGLGTPTLLVNNAGSWNQVGPVQEADPLDWWRDIETSLKGTFLCTRAVLPAMLAAERGRIVTVSSYAAVSPQPYMTGYAAAKAAVARFTDSLAAELQGRGVLAFTITPGFVRTDLLERVASSAHGRKYLPRLGQRRDALDPALAARLVVDIASGRVDRLAGRFLHVLDDLDDMLGRSQEIVERDLYVLRLVKS